MIKILRFRIHQIIPLIIASTWMIIFCTCENSDKIPAKNWYKGNLHTHSFWSDGDDFPEMIMDWYKQNGYHFVSLTEHNIIAEGEKWIGIAEDSLYRAVFDKYQERFGHTNIQAKEDSGALRVLLKTLAEYRPLFEEPERFLIIQAEEVTAQFERRPLHLNVNNLASLLEPQGGSSVVEVLQNNIDAVRKMRSTTGRPMMVHVNHPNFGYAISLEDMIQLEGEQFFEVFNGHPLVHNQGDSSHIGTEEMWDLVNMAYLAKDKPLLYGLATDDAHNFHRQGDRWSNAGRGWVMVRADSLNAASLIGALERGDFYGSTGVKLKTLDQHDNQLAIEIDPEVDVSYTIQFVGSEKGAMTPTVFEEIEGTQATFKLESDISFVRARIISTKKHANPIEELDYEMAWTQPMMFKENK